MMTIQEKAEQTIAGLDGNNKNTSRSMVKHLFAFLEPTTPLQNVGEYEMSKFKEYLTDKGMSPKSAVTITSRMRFILDLQPKMPEEEKQKMEIDKRMAERLPKQLKWIKSWEGLYQFQKSTGNIYDRRGRRLIEPLLRDGVATHALTDNEGTTVIYTVEELRGMMGKTSLIGQSNANQGVSEIGEAFASSAQTIRELNDKIKALEMQIEKMKRYWRE